MDEYPYGNGANVRRIGQEPEQREQSPLDRRVMPEEMRAQLAAIRELHPEMTDLSAILQSELGRDFREFVRRGMDYVDTYTLAARNWMHMVSGDRERTRQGEEAPPPPRSAGGESPVPPGVMAQFRNMAPDTAEEDIRKYYAADRARMGR